MLSQLLRRPVFPAALLLVLFGFVSLSAQDDNRPTAKLLPFTYSKTTTVTDADEVSRMVKQYINSSGRFRIVGGNYDDVLQELDRQKDAIFLDGEMVAQASALGAKYLIAGHLVNNQEGNAYATVELGVVDVASGETRFVQILSPKGRDQKIITNTAGETVETVSGPYQNQDERIAIKLGSLAGGLINKSLEKNVTDYLDEFFPMTFMIYEKEESKGATSGILLYGYQTYTFKKGETLRVVKRKELKTPDGRISILETELGTVRVDELKGDFAHAKVYKKFQDELTEALADPTVVVVK